jgi:subtilase family protein
MLRRGSAVAVLLAALAVVLFEATTGNEATTGPPPRSTSPDAPVNLTRPYLQEAGSADDELQVTPQAGSWRSPVHGPVRFSYSWDECDPTGRNCSPIPGLQARTISPPQELRIVTLRGVVTATNGAGSTSVTTNDFDYDMAGLAFKASDAGFVRGNLQYNPDQLRAWYGLRPAQTGAGQTIVITDFGRQRGLRSEVDHFSAHYGLPQTCRPSHSGDCFRLVITSAGDPGRVNLSGEGDADVEWAHAIAPEAKIVFVQFNHAQPLLDKLGWLGDEGRDSVVSDSWCDPCRGFRGFAREVVYPAVALACGRPHVVCVQATGDHGSPGDKPSNSPEVLAVGGTTFTRQDDGSTRGEVPWGPSGSGDTDVQLPRPAWQKGIVAGCAGGDFSLTGVSSCAKRAVPDVSATAASVPDFQPTRRHGPAWFVFNGTSLSTPLWAALIAVTDQQLRQDGQRPVGIDELHQVLYRGDVTAGLDDIPPHGWDLATGLGSPRSGIVTALAGAIERYRAGG